MIKKSFTFSLILWASSVSAQDGVSAYQMFSPHWSYGQCTKLLESLGRLANPAIAVLPFSFGQEYGCWDRLHNQAASNLHKTYFVEMHFSNEVGRRHRRLGPAEWLPRMTTSKYNSELKAMRPEFQELITGRLETFKGLLSTSPNVVYLLSTGLENNFTYTASRNLLKFITGKWPGPMVVNPVRNNNWRHDGQHYYERHGFNSVSKVQRGRCIINGDGISPNFYRTRFKKERIISIRNVIRWRRGTNASQCLRLLWAARWQDSKEQFKAQPTKRKFKFDRNDVNFIKSIWA